MDSSTRFMSVLCTKWPPPRRERRRLALLVCSKWRLPAAERNTLPVAVILNRLAKDFLVLIPFGRRINSVSLQRARNIGRCADAGKLYFPAQRLSQRVAAPLTAG